MHNALKFRKANGEMVSVSETNPLPTAGGGGSGGGGGLTDTQLRAEPVPMVPMLTSSGNIEIAVVADTPKQLPPQACKQVVLANNSVSPGWVIQDGKKFPLFAQAYMSFFGITNTNQLSVQLPEVGDVYAHWES